VGEPHALDPSRIEGLLGSGALLRVHAGRCEDERERDGELAHARWYPRARGSVGTRSRSRLREAHAEGAVAGPGASLGEGALTRSLGRRKPERASYAAHSG
jgi:hypothetical protein